LRRYVVHICEKCGAQQWFSGTCDEPGCFGRARSFHALTIADIKKHAENDPEAEAYVDSLLADSLPQPSG
jgi:hypothetical protein